MPVGCALGDVLGLGDVGNAENMPKTCRNIKLWLWLPIFEL
jgi:hypothetical protein